MNWTKSMQEGWYYYTTNDLDHPDGIKWMDVSVTQADLDEMTITLLGPVPAPGTTFTEKEIFNWLSSIEQRYKKPCMFTAKLDLQDKDTGIAATTERSRKEQG